MNEIIECVPNISEGRNHKIIEKLSDSIIKTIGVKLLHVDIGESANRTVFTFAGPPDCVIEAAFNLITEAKRLIDMSKHTGSHPRIGAVDVCPLVPVSNITIEETKKYAIELATRTGEILNLPVYLYEKSALLDERKNLENIRRGEYESLSSRMHLPEWKPDYGPAVFDSRFGAIAIGARNFLIAYNVNLYTKDVKIAKLIAGIVRESGVIANVEKEGVNSQERIPGILRYVKAIGWYDERYKCAQVSTNIIDYRINTIKNVFDTIKEIAKKYNTEVTGSEIIGLIPINSIFSDFDIEKYSESDDIRRKKLKIFEKKIMLKLWNENDLYDKIIEYRLMQ